MKSKVLPIKKIKIHYLEGGKGDTIVLLPSGWLTSKSYKQFGESLSNKYNILIPDLYKGKSVFQNQAITFKDYVEVLNSFVNGL